MPDEPTPSPDPIYRSSLRELKWIIAIWACGFAWVIGYCSLFGYDVGEPIQLTFGMPSWAFWGVFLPWGAATVVSCWFALTQMQDHQLDDPSADEAEAADG